MAFKLILQRSHSKTRPYSGLTKSCGCSKDCKLPSTKLYCAFLASGCSLATCYSLLDCGPEFEQMQSVKDLGISLKFSLKPAHRIAAVFFPLYCTLGHSYLTYAMKGTSPYFMKYITLKGCRGWQRERSKGSIINVSGFLKKDPFKNDDGYRV